MQFPSKPNNFKFLKTIEEIFSYDKYNLQTEKEFILYKNGNTVKIKENLENKKFQNSTQSDFFIAKNSIKITIIIYCNFQ